MNNEPKVTRLAEGTIVKGEISFSGGKLRVEGDLLGNVTSAESVEIVQTGKVIGDVNAAEIELLGKIEGNIKTKKLVVRPTGVLTGNLEVEHFVMEEGGRILGEVKMNLGGDSKDSWKGATPKPSAPTEAPVTSKR